MAVEAKIIDVDFTEKRRRKANRIRTEMANRWYNFKYRAKKLGVTIVTHPQESITVLTVGSLGYSLIRKVVRDIKPTSTDKIFKRQQNEIYDPQLKVWWPLRRKLSVNDKLEFESRRKNGESVAEALRNMKLMKNR